MLNYTSQPSPGTAQLRTTSQVALLIYACSLHGDVEDYKTRRARLGLINISGLAARTAGTPSGSIRNVAVAALTKNLADELSRSGINVTVVHPESP